MIFFIFKIYFIGTILRAFRFKKNIKFDLIFSNRIPKSDL